MRIDRWLRYQQATIDGRPIRLILASLIRDDPDEPWGAFLDLMTHGPAEAFDDLERGANAVMRYDNDVLNGGHLQYFVNVRNVPKDLLHDGLRRIGAVSHAAILSEAVNRWESKTRKRPESLMEFSEIAMEGEFRDLDDRYYRQIPDIDTLLKDWFKKNQEHFIRVVDDEEPTR